MSVNGPSQKSRARMKDRLRNLMKGRAGFFIRLFGTLLAVALLIYLLSQQGWDEIAEAIRSIPFWRFVLAMSLMFVSRFAVWGRWHVLLRASKLQISAGQSLRITFAGLFASNFLPTTIGGDVIRLAGVLQLSTDAVVSAASLIVDRLVGMAGMAMAVPFGLPSFLRANVLSNSGDTLENLGWVEGYLTKDSPAFLAVLPLSRWWRIAWEKGQSLLRRLRSALSLWIGQPRALVVSLGLTWIHMLCFFAILSIFFVGMGDHVSFWLIGGLYSLVYFITLMPLSINGYGIQEVSLTFIFSAVGGTSLQSSLTAALLLRTMMMFASLPGAIFVPALMPGTRRKAEITEKARIIGD